MAEIDSYTKSQRLLSDTVSSTQPNQANTSKIYTHFLYKAAIVTVFLVIIPLFPSQAPEFINQTLLTRSWELLHLLFVGIAVSYGLFSRRNEETEKENLSKFDNAHSYVSRFLQVSSVFDEEAETPSGSDENKIQTWNNQYQRGEPVVVVAQESSVLDEQRSTVSRHGEKPLLLPVRSLKSRVSDAGFVNINSGDSGFSGSISRSNSNSGSKRFSNNSSKTRSGEFGGLDNPLNLDEKLEENVVLPSPIPWRSRSGRLEMKEADFDGSPMYTLPPSMEESEFNRLESRSSRSQSSRSSRPNSTSSSPNKLSPSPSLSSPKKPSPSPSLSSESQAKNVEDSVRKKSFHRSSPPPPPMSCESPLMKSNSRPNSDGVSFEKDLRRSFSNEPKDLSRISREDMMRRVNSATDIKLRAQTDVSSTGKSVRTVRVVDQPFAGAWKGREVVEDGFDVKAEKRSKEVNESILKEKTGRKVVGFDQSSVRSEKLIRESIPVMPKPTFSNFQKEGNGEFMESVMVESDYDSENEGDDIDGSSNKEEGDSFPVNDGGPDVDKKADGRSDKEEGDSFPVNDGGPDVDKKADEFIAKFREQIRLQRIASIKKSSGQINRNASSIQTGMVNADNELLKESQKTSGLCGSKSCMNGF